MAGNSVITISFRELHKYNYATKLYYCINRIIRWHGFNYAME